MPWVVGTNLSSYGCNVSDKFVLYTHGFNDYFDWVNKTAEKYLQYRGGCVIFYDYSPCVDFSNYIKTLTYFNITSAVITKKLNDMVNESISPDNIHLYGFSLGAQMMIKGAIDFGPDRVASLDGNIVLIKIQA